ncbi:MAG: hypothetical protein HYX72_04380 [Acidobacteria bacterium]|nr:hypothetical protein [Acidobacteriota bacterium]
MASRHLVRCRRRLASVVLLPAIWLASLIAGAQTQTPSQLPGQSAPITPSAPPGSVPGTASPPAQGPQTPPALGGISTVSGIDTGRLQFLEIRAFSNLQRITGAARDRSFLTPGNNNSFDFSFLQDITRGPRRFELVSVARYTTDNRVDPERSSIQKAYFRIHDPHYEWNFGDYLVSYSRFTYNQNLKGVHFIGRWGNFRLMTNGGTFTDRYGSLFKENLPGKPFTRIVSGLRAEQRIARDKLIAINWAYGLDLASSIPADENGLTFYKPVENNVVSLDTRMTFFRKWDMQAELAYSLTNPDASENGDFVRRTVCPCGTIGKDYAVRFDNSFRAGSWTLGQYYTRMMPSFFAVNARQVSDLQDLMVRVSNQIARQATLQFSYRRTDDNLRGQNVNPTTLFQLPEVRLSLRDLPGLGNTLLDFGYRERHQRQQDLASRFTRTPFVEVGIPISSSVLTVGFEHRANIDRINRTQQTWANDVTVGFRSIFNLGDWMFTPLVRWQLNRELYDRVPTGTNNRNIQAGVVLEAPRWFVFEALYRQVGATLFQDEPLLDSETFRPMLNPNGLPIYAVTGPSGFRRPAAHFAITYKINNNENRTITISYDRNNNLFALPNQNFLERIMQVTLVWRFRRQ